MSTIQFQKVKAQWDESRFKYVDVIVSSGEIRKQFFTRCKELKVNPYRLAIKFGISLNAFTKNYVKTEFPECTKSFDQERFLKMIEFIGINIRVVVCLKPLSEVSVELNKNGIETDYEDSELII